jgi:hypothetical protein
MNFHDIPLWTSATVFGAEGLCFEIAFGFVSIISGKDQPTHDQRYLMAMLLLDRHTSEESFPRIMHIPMFVASSGVRQSLVSLLVTVFDGIQGPAMHSTSASRHRLQRLCLCPQLFSNRRLATTVYRKHAYPSRSHLRHIDDGSPASVSSIRPTWDRRRCCLTDRAANAASLSVPVPGML